MTITAQLYDEINGKLIEVLEQYKEQMTQYDMLVIAVNLLVSYMEVIVRFDQYDRQKLVDEIVHMIKTTNLDGFTSRN